jgi:beta-glucosidase
MTAVLKYACRTAHKYLPTLEENLVTPSGEPGWLCTFYNHNAEGNPSEELCDFVLHDTRVKLNDFLPPGLTPTWSIKLRGLLTTDKTATYELGLTVAGRLIAPVSHMHSKAMFHKAARNSGLMGS